MELGHIPQMLLTPALTAALARASDVAVASGAREVTVEHLLFSLCDDPDAISVLEASRVDVAQLKVETAAYLSAPHPGQRPAAREAPPSSDAARILEAAAAAARGGRRRDVNGAIVLAAIVGDGRSFAAHLLHNHGLTFDEAIRALQRSLSQPSFREAQPYVPHAEDVLAQARERVQSRAQPTLRDLIGDRGRPATAPAPVSPPQEADDGAPGADLLDAAPTADQAAIGEGDKSAKTATEAASAQPHDDPAAAAEGAAVERIQDTRQEPSFGDEPLQRQPEPSPPAEEAVESSQPAREPAQSARVPAGDTRLRGAGEPFGVAPYEAPSNQPFDALAEPPLDLRDIRAAISGWVPRPVETPSQGPSTIEIPRPVPVQPPPIPPLLRGRMRPTDDEFPFPYRAAPAPAPRRSEQLEHDWRTPAAPQDAFAGPVEPTFGEPPPYRPRPTGPFRQPIPGPDFGCAPPPVFDARPQQFPTQDPSAGMEARGPASPPMYSPAQQAAPISRAQQLDSGQLTENIPRSMRVAQTERVEVRIANSTAKAVADNLDGGGAAWRHDIIVTKAMSVRLRAPDGGFFIETASPETQWIENQLGLASDDFASWRFLVTPQERGRSRLQIVVSARTVGSDGVAAETALPDQIVDVKVRTNYRRTFAKWSGWIIAAIVGGALASFGETGFDAANHYIAKFIN